ncbi:MAG: hypothetical protein JEY71_10250 [Sphaerochaeta sp.]|nr:hypothetical protein [Sphaerochaeta sp.]
MRQQRPLDGLPPEIVQALEEGRAIDEELRRIVMEREKLDEKEMQLIEQRARTQQRAERANARPITPGQAGEDKGGLPMSKIKNKTSSPARQAQPAPTSYQLSLFSYDVVEQYSNVALLYGEIPKYVCDAPRDKKHLDSIERDFVVDGTRYRVVLHPARLKVKGGDGSMTNTIELFIGGREELVEDAITKIAIDKRRLYTISDTTRIKITIAEIQTELKRMKHTLSYEQIKESIQVLSGARMILEDLSGEAVWSTSTYPEYMLSSESQDGQGFVQLHPLVAESIKRGFYLQYDYALGMSLTGRYSKRLHKMLSQKFLWANPNREPFVVHLRWFLGNDGFTRFKRFTDNGREFRKGLESLVSKRVLLRWEEVPKKEGRTIVDYTYTLWPTPEFCRGVIRSNSIRKDVRRMLEKEKR